MPKVRDPVRKEAEKWKAKLEDEKAKYKISLSALRGKEPFELKHLDLSNGEGHFGRLFAELKDLKKGVNLLTQDFKNRLAQVHSVSLKDKVKTNDVEKGGRRNLRTVGAILKEGLCYVHKDLSYWVICIHFSRKVPGILPKPSQSWEGFEDFGSQFWFAKFPTRSAHFSLGSRAYI